MLLKYLDKFRKCLM